MLARKRMKRFVTQKFSDEEWKKLKAAMGTRTWPEFVLGRKPSSERPRPVHSNALGKTKVRRTMITLEQEEFDIVLKRKRTMTWHEYIMSLAERKKR
ncbi:MAG: hypothetical protein OK422_04405 [Thaumarchaeota archaeon]|nr:hypothetical protein [Nitrososphaerota archaeon]